MASAGGAAAGLSDTLPAVPSPPLPGADAGQRAAGSPPQLVRKAARHVKTTDKTANLNAARRRGYESAGHSAVLRPDEVMTDEFVPLAPVQSSVWGILKGAASLKNALKKSRTPRGSSRDLLKSKAIPPVVQLRALNAKHPHLEQLAAKSGTLSNAATRPEMQSVLFESVKKVEWQTNVSGQPSKFWEFPHAPRPRPATSSGTSGSNRRELFIMPTDPSEGIAQAARWRSLAAGVLTSRVGAASLDPSPLLPRDAPDSLPLESKTYTATEWQSMLSPIRPATAATEQRNNARAQFYSMGKALATAPTALPGTAPPARIHSFRLNNAAPPDPQPEKDHGDGSRPASPTQSDALASPPPVQRTKTSSRLVRTGTGYFENCEALGIMPEAAGMLCDAEFNQTPTLDLSGHGLGNQFIEAVKSGLSRLTSLQQVNLSRNRFSPTAIADLINHLPHGIHTLDLSHNDVGPVGASALTFAIQSGALRLKILKLSDAHIGDNAAATLITSLADHDYYTFRELHVDSNQLGARSAVALQNLLKSTQIQVLDVAWNMFSGAAAADLATGVHKNRTLQDLNLSWNAFGSASRASNAPSAAQMLHTIGGHPSLVHVNLSKTMLSHAESEALLTEMDKNSNLVGLHIDHHPGMNAAHGHEAHDLSSGLEKALQIWSVASNDQSKVAEAAQTVTEPPSGCWICDGWQSVRFHVELQLPDTETSHVVAAHFEFSHWQGIIGQPDVSVLSRTRQWEFALVAPVGTHDCVFTIDGVPTLTASIPTRHNVMPIILQYRVVSGKGRWHPELAIPMKFNLLTVEMHHDDAHADPADRLANAPKGLRTHAQHTTGSSWTWTPPRSPLYQFVQHLWHVETHGVVSMPVDSSNELVAAVASRQAPLVHSLFFHFAGLGGDDSPIASMASSAAFLFIQTFDASSQVRSPSGALKFPQFLDLLRSVAAVLYPMLPATAAITTFLASDVLKRCSCQFSPAWDDQLFTQNVSTLLLKRHEQIVQLWKTLSVDVEGKGKRLLWARLRFLFERANIVFNVDTLKCAYLHACAGHLTDGLNVPGFMYFLARACEVCLPATARPDMKLVDKLDSLLTRIIDGVITIPAKQAEPAVTPKPPKAKRARSRRGARKLKQGSSRSVVSTGLRSPRAPSKSPTK